MQTSTRSPHPTTWLDFRKISKCSNWNVTRENVVRNEKLSMLLRLTERLVPIRNHRIEKNCSKTLEKSPLIILPILQGYFGSIMPRKDEKWEFFWLFFPQEMQLYILDHKTTHPQCDYSLDGSPLGRVFTIIDLGVLMDTWLKLEEHIDTITRKSLKILGLINSVTVPFTNVDCLITSGSTSISVYSTQSLTIRH